MEVKLSQPLLPLRDIVVFPSMVIPLFVGRDKSINALNEVMKNDKKIILVTQKNSEVDDPKQNDIFSYGCESSILQLLKLPDGTVIVLVEGKKRVKILNYETNNKDYFTCDAQTSEDVNISKDLEQYASGLIKKFEKLQVLSKKDFNDSEKKKNFSDFLFSVFSPSPTHILAQSFLLNHLCSPIQAQPLCCEFSFAENSNYPEVTYSYILHRFLASAYMVYTYGFVKSFANDTRATKRCEV